MIKKNNMEVLQGGWHSFWLVLHASLRKCPPSSLMADVHYPVSYVIFSTLYIDWDHYQTAAKRTGLDKISKQVIAKRGVVNCLDHNINWIAVCWTAYTLVWEGLQDSPSLIKFSNLYMSAGIPNLPIFILAGVYFQVVAEKLIRYLKTLYPITYKQAFCIQYLG